MKIFPFALHCTVATKWCRFNGLPANTQSTYVRSLSEAKAFFTLATAEDLGNFFFPFDIFMAVMVEENRLRLQLPSNLKGVLDRGRMFPLILLVFSQWEWEGTALRFLLGFISSMKLFMLSSEYISSEEELAVSHSSSLFLVQVLVFILKNRLFPIQRWGLYLKKKKIIQSTLKFTMQIWMWSTYIHLSQ